MAYNIGVANFRCTWFQLDNGVPSPGQFVIVRGGLPSEVIQDDH